MVLTHTTKVVGYTDLMKYVFLLHRSEQKQLVTSLTYIYNVKVPSRVLVLHRQPQTEDERRRMPRPAHFRTSLDPRFSSQLRCAQDLAEKRRICHVQTQFSVSS